MTQSEMFFSPSMHDYVNKNSLAGPPTSCTPFAELSPEKCTGKMSSAFQLDSVDEALKEALKSPVYDEVHRVLYGREHKELEIPKEALEIAKKNNFDLKAYEVLAKEEELRAPRKPAIQKFSILWRVLPTTAPIEEQRRAIHRKAATMVDAAVLAGANMICFHELWTMPFAFCTRERLPWTQFAESAEHGPTTQSSFSQAKSLSMFATVAITRKIG
ncbi:hypothetical protein OSTOST_00468 [Ostertagia ostertagi]